MRAAWFLAGTLALGACGGPGRPPAPPALDGAISMAPAPPVAPAAAADRAGGPGPARLQSGVPAGFERTRNGAAAAATTYLSTLHQLVGSGEDERRAALDVLTATGAGAVVDDALAAYATIDDLVTEARATDPNARLFMREVPVAYTVARFNDERARVEVWSLGIIMIDAVTEAAEVWATNSVELVWEAGDWKVWSWSRRPGPQPSLVESAPVPSLQVLDAIDGWQGYRYVPAA